MKAHPAIAPDQVAVVTGAASGIGLAAARRLVEAGLRVCLADADAENLRAAQAALGARALAVPTDVADRSSVEALARTVARELGPVSVLMNNAGVGGGGDALSNSEGWSRVLGVTLFGVLHGVPSTSGVKTTRRRARSTRSACSGMRSTSSRTAPRSRAGIPSGRSGSRRSWLGPIEGSWSSALGSRVGLHTFVRRTKQLTRTKPPWCSCARVDQCDS